MVRDIPAHIKWMWSIDQTFNLYIEDRGTWKVRLLQNNSVMGIHVWRTGNMS